MTLKEDLQKKLLDLHIEELKHTYTVKSGLEKKADNYIKISGVVLGLFSTISAIFFITSDNIGQLSAMIFLGFYFLGAFITVVYMIKTIKSAVDVFKTLTYFRVEYISTFFHGEDITTDHVKKVLGYAELDIISKLINTYIIAITQNRENNQELKEEVENCYQDFKMGLRFFIITIAIMLLIGIIINLP